MLFRSSVVTFGLLHELSGNCLAPLPTAFQLPCFAIAKTELSPLDELPIQTQTCRSDSPSETFLAAGKLIHDVIESLQDVGGAKSEYQELTRELRSLEKALQLLDNLRSDSSSQDRTIQSIKFAALSCRQPLEQFLAKIKKFDSTLDVWAKGQTSKSIVRKVQWGLGMKNEVIKLQGYLDLHIATINMLLAEHSLEKMSLAQERANSDSFQIHERLGQAQNVIERIGNTVTGQMALIQHTNTTMRNLMNMICGDFMTSWRSLSQKCIHATSLRYRCRNQSIDNPRRYSLHVFPNTTSM